MCVKFIGVFISVCVPNSFCRIHYVCVQLMGVSTQRRSQVSLVGGADRIPGGADRIPGGE